MPNVILRCALALLAALHPAQTPVQAQPQDMGVAYVVQAITLRGATIRTEAIHRPERITPAAAVIGITRIDVPAGAAVFLSPAQIEQLAYTIADTADLPRVNAVQVDFDATIAQRCLYRELIHRVRDLLPSHVPLSITALASWCMDDDWISDLPLAEVVPMLRLGQEWKVAATRARERGLVADSPCRNALELAGDR